jgi:hypothetical protein
LFTGSQAALSKKKKKEKKEKKINQLCSTFVSFKTGASFPYTCNRFGLHLKIFLKGMEIGKKKGGVSARVRLKEKKKCSV